MDVSYVLDGLYLGSRDSVYFSDKLTQIGISHILTLEAKPVEREYTEGLVVKFVHAFDMDSQDLLQHFQDCIQFIDEGRAGGGVLVHCFAGTSRSATVVIAYMMTKLDLTLEDVLRTLKKARSRINPNPGFMQQLELFEMMGNRIDPMHNKYKMYRLDSLAQRMQEANMQYALPDEMLTVDPSLSKLGELGCHYKCKKCRRPLFKATAQLVHQTGKGGAAFDWRARLTPQELGLEEAEECKKSLFVEPLKWMREDILQQTGKLGCPKCHAKLGSFSWFGEHCPCGTWITPAFHIQPSKVDKCLPRIVPVAVPRQPKDLATDQQHSGKSTTANSSLELSPEKEMEKLKT